MTCYLEKGLDITLLKTFLESQVEKKKLLQIVQNYLKGWKVTISTFFTEPFKGVTYKIKCSEWLPDVSGLITWNPIENILKAPDIRQN